MESISRIMARVDELSLRERAIIMSAVLLILFLGWYSYAMEPLIKEEANLQGQLASKRNQLQQLNDQFTQLSERRNRDPDADNRTRITELRTRIGALGTELEGATAQLVAPSMMPDILRQVLNKSQGLTLKSLTGLGATPLLAAGGGAASQAQAPADGDLTTAYKHGMQLELSGDFPRILAYLQALETLEWNFFWDSLDYEVTGYPQARVTITLYTLSLNNNWISI